MNARLPAHFRSRFSVHRVPLSSRSVSATANLPPTSRTSDLLRALTALETRFHSFAGPAACALSGGCIAATELVAGSGLLTAVVTKFVAVTQSVLGKRFHLKSSRARDRAATKLSFRQPNHLAVESSLWVLAEELLHAEFHACAPANRESRPKASCPRRMLLLPPLQLKACRPMEGETLPP